MFSGKKCFIFIALFIASPVWGADSPYWGGIVDLLSGNSSLIKKPACPEQQKIPADLFSSKDPLIVNTCIQDICGKPKSNLDALVSFAGLKDLGLGRITAVSPSFPMYSMAGLESCINTSNNYPYVHHSPGGRLDSL